MFYKIYEIDYVDHIGMSHHVTKKFKNRDEMMKWLTENGYELRKYRVNHLKTFYYFIMKIIFPGKELGAMKDIELLSLLKLLRTMYKYRQDESKMNLIFENYASYDKRYKNLKKALSKLTTQLKYGTPLDKALEQIGVPSFISRSIKVGSESGKAVQIYDRLIDLIETKIYIKKLISKMLLLPKITMFFLYGYFLLIMFVMVPKTKELIGLMGSSKMPYISKLLYNWSDTALAHPVTFVILTSIFLIILYKLIYKGIAYITRYIPYVKDVYKAQDYTLLTALLSVALSARIQLHDAIAFAAEVVQDNKLKSKLLEVSERVGNRGERFSKALKDLGFNRGSFFEMDFYNTVFAMEDSGDLDKSFDELYIEFKDRLKEVIDKATTFINPVVLVFIASILILLYAGVNAPLFNMGRGAVGSQDY